MKLIRENIKNANLARLYSQIQYLEQANELSVETEESADIIKTIIKFQDKDGSFKMLNTYQVRSDIRHTLCHYPTYLCTALLIKSYLYNNKSVDLDKLNEALVNCCHRDLLGHGYEGLESQLKIMKLFSQCGIRELIKLNCNQKFCEMITSILDSYKERIKNEDYNFGFGNYETEIKEIVKLYEK